MKKLIACIVLTSVLGLTACNPEQTFNDALDSAGKIGGDFENDKKIDIYGDAKEIIKQNISSPSEAVFPNYDDKDVAINLPVNDNSIAIVAGYVDAPNLVGVKTRAYYSLTIKYNETAGIGNYIDYQLNDVQQ